MGQLPLGRVIVRMLRLGFKQEWIANKLRIDLDRLNQEIEIWKQGVLRKARGKPICKCCMERPIMDGNKFLCRKCYLHPPADTDCHILKVAIHRSMGQWDTSYNELNQNY